MPSPLNQGTVEKHTTARLLHVCSTHMFEGDCDKGVCKALCGARMSGADGTLTPPPEDRCVVCASMFGMS
jgi:hypothetical protein